MILHSRIFQYETGHPCKGWGSASEGGPGAVGRDYGGGYTSWSRRCTDPAVHLNGLCTEHVKRRRRGSPAAGGMRGTMP